MKEFFLDNKISIPFVLFGKIHIICISILIVGLITIYKFRNKIKKIKFKPAKKIKFSMFLILFLNMTIYYGSYIYYGIYNWKVHLPLHFCFIAGILFMIYLLTNNRKLYKIIFPLTFIGPLPAIFYPDLSSSLDYFVFYQYFISHHLLMIFSYFILYLDDFTITNKDTINTFILANIIFVTMAIFNQIFQTNYIMSNKLPDFILELYPVLKNIWPPIILEIIGIIVLFLISILTTIKNKEDKKRMK